MKICSTGTFTYPPCTNFSAKSRAGKSYEISKKPSKSKARVVHISKTCYKDVDCFYLLREHQLRKHGTQGSSVAQKVDATKLMADIEDNSLKGELETCKHFLVEIEIENGRHRIYIFALDTLDSKYLLEKLDIMYVSLKCAAKRKVAFGFVLKNMKTENVGINLYTKKLHY